MLKLTDDETTAARKLIVLAYDEDLGTTGDRTTLALIPEAATATAAFVSRSGGTIAGLPVAALAIAARGPKLQFQTFVTDGDMEAPGTCIAHAPTHPRRHRGSTPTRSHQHSPDALRHSERYG